MAAGERGAEGGGDGLEFRAGAIDELLDRLGEDLVPEDHRHQERHDPAVARAGDLDARDRDRDDDHGHRLAQIGDEGERVVRPGARVAVAPFGDALSSPASTSVLRTTTASRASTTPPARIATSASVSASPVAFSGSSRAARAARRPVTPVACLPASRAASTTAGGPALPG